MTPSPLQVPRRRVWTVCKVVNPVATVRMTLSVVWLFFTEHFILVLNLMKQILSEENSSVLNAKKKNGNRYLI